MLIHRKSGTLAVGNSVNDVAWPERNVTACVHTRSCCCERLRIYLDELSRCKFDSVRRFDEREISLLTDGRPDILNTKLPAGTTDILVSYTYRIAFTDAGANFGLAAAISTVIFFLVAILSLLNLKMTQSNE